MVARLQRAQTIGRLGSWEIDLRSRRMWASPEAFRIYGFEITPTSDLPLEVVQSVPLAQCRPILDRAMAALLAGEADYDVEFEICRVSDGAIRHIRSRAELSRDEQGEPRFISGIVHDDTEIVERNAAMLKSVRDSEEWARAIFEQAADAIFFGNHQGDFIAVNERAVELTGYTREELLGGNMHMLFSAEVQGAKPLRYDLILKGEVLVTERVLTRKDGSTAPIEMRTKMLSNGALQSIMRDLSERRKLEEQLQLRQRLDSIGVLTAGIAHDFNNILAGIVGYVSLLGEGAARLDPEQRDCVENIRVGTQRATELIHGLRALSHPVVSEIRDFDLFDVASEVVRFLEATTDRVILKRLSFAKGCCVVHGNASNVHHVLTNLGINAVQVIEQRGSRTGDSVSFEAEVCELQAGHRLSVPPGKYVHVAVRDTGEGMTEEVKQHAFDPLYSTKEKGERKGQGLGLAMVYNIVVRQHHGAIEVETSPGAGCCVHLYLPAGTAARAVSEAPRPVVIQGGEHILFVEDEPQLSRLAQRALERHGFRISVAADGLTAVELFERDAAAFDLVVLDRSLPGMRGEQVYARIRIQRPEVPVIVSSGDAFVSEEDFPGVQRLLRKPYTPKDLAGAVREVLDAQGPRPAA